MTTIACNRRMMAADSRAVMGGLIYTTRKIHRVQDALIGASGYADAMAAFIEWYVGEHSPRDYPSFEQGFGAIVLTPEGIFNYEQGGGPIEVLDDYFADGSGAHVASTAMWLGKSPFEAVEIACELDVNTGPPIVVEKL